jgi:protocatechuate 3,4-dioxygenase beta subunit
VVFVTAPGSREWLSQAPDSRSTSGGPCEEVSATEKLLALAAEHRGESPPLARALTDERGRFRLDGLEAGTFALWAESGEGIGLSEVAAGSEDVEVRVGSGLVFSGVVLDERGGAVAGALVTTLLWDAGRFFETSTDDAGRFRLGPLPRGRYDSGFIVSKAGFLPALLDSGLSERSGREVTLLAPRRISGRVLGVEGPVPGVTVQLEGAAWIPSATTDARGDFQLEGLCPGAYVVTARREARYAVREVLMRAGQDVESVELILGASLRLSGRVTDASGRPIAGAEVLVVGSEPRRRRTVQTRPGGDFLIEPLTPGSYQLWIQAEHYVPEYLPARVLQASEALHITLQDAVRLEGHTVDEKGAPVEGATLRLVSLDGERFRASTSVQSGTDGAFALEVPKPGSCRVGVMVRHEDFPSEEFPLSAPARGVRLTMRSGATLEARLVDEAGRPVTQAGFSLLSEPGGGKRTILGTEGGTVFRGLSPGRYTLEAWPLGEEGRSVEQAVEVRGAEAHEVSLQLAPDWSLSGEVVDGHGNPIEGASIAARPDFGPERFVPRWVRGRSGPDGRFTLEHLGDGAWVLQVNKEGYALDAENSEGVSVSRGSPGVRLVLASQARIRGRVLRENGEPVTEFLLGTVQVRHPEGRFSLPVTEHGAQTLRFEAPGFFRTEREVNPRLGEDTELADVVLVEAREVRGRVLEAGTSAPIMGARVQVVGGGRSRRSFSGPLDTSTRPDGSFSLGGLEDGAELLVTDLEHLPWRGALAPGQREMTVVLETGATVEGRVEADGVPVPTGTATLRSERGVVTTTGFWQGRYSLRAVPVGRYLLQVMARLGEDAEGVFPAREVDVPARGRVTVDFTKRSGGVTVEVRSWERVLEVHLLPGSQPLLGPKQGLNAKLVGGVMGTPTPQGLWRFPGLSPGLYTLFVVHRMEDGTQVHREEVKVPAEGAASFSVLPMWSRFDD